MNANPKKDRVNAIRFFLLRRARRNNFDSLQFRLKLKKLVQELLSEELPLFS
ncbi:MAG: hypothetical protein ACFFCD_10630 [Promethearchaeota archaeon]